MHEGQFSKRRTLELCGQRRLGKKLEVDRYSRFICEGCDLREYANSRKTCSAVCFKSARATMRDVTYATLMPTVYKSGFEMCRQHIGATTSGMELMGGGNRRLLCNVKSDEMCYFIWICEGLVIVFLTDTCHRLRSSVKGSKRGTSNARASTQVEELAIHPFSEIPLAELRKDNAHRNERRLIKSESDSYSGQQWCLFHSV